MSDTRKRIGEIKHELTRLDEIYQRELKQLEFENTRLREEMKRMNDLAQEKLDEKDARIEELDHSVAALRLHIDAISKVRVGALSFERPPKQAPCPRCAKFPVLPEDTVELIGWGDDNKGKHHAVETINAGTFKTVTGYLNLFECMGSSWRKVEPAQEAKP